MEINVQQRLSETYKKELKTHMVMGMGISTKVITDFNRLLEIENIWNRELLNYSEDPLLYSRLFSEFMQFWESKRWTPMVFTFWSNNRLVGMAPLKMQETFYSKYVCNLEGEVYSNFIVFDEYREICMTQLVDLLFNRLNCWSAVITLDSSSPNLRLLEKVCETKGLHFRKTPYNGRAIIPVETGWDQFYGSLKNSVRKEFRRTKRKMDDLGSWKISCAEIDSNSVERIFAVERMSWKAEWRARNNLQEDYTLRGFLKAHQPKGEIEPICDSEIWFLEVDGLAIAYQIVLLYKGTAVFAKTSYDGRFKSFSPGKFLLNGIIREVFSKRNVKKIDFITNLPFVQIWNPVCENRTRVTIERHHFLSATVRFVHEIPLIRNFVKLVKN